jgi:Ca2+-binding EF-hand superfamily protein
MTRTQLSSTSRVGFIQLSLILIATGCAAGVFAQTSPPPAKGPAMVWIGDLDVKHEGRISKQEAAAVPAIAKAFDSIDINHDGYISMSEVKAMWHAEFVQKAQQSVQGRMAAFAKADTKHEGKISLDQAKAAGMTFVVANFKAFDANHDGFISKDEMQKGSVALAQQVLATRGQRMQALFAKADANHDGKLSPAEFAGAFPKFAPSFAFFDENHDGFIGPNEFALPPGF